MRYTERLRQQLQALDLRRAALQIEIAFQEALDKRASKPAKHCKACGYLNTAHESPCKPAKLPSEPIGFKPVSNKSLIIPESRWPAWRPRHPDNVGRTS